MFMLLLMMIILLSNKPMNIWLVKKLVYATYLYSWSGIGTLKLKVIWTKQPLNTICRNSIIRFEKELDFLQLVRMQFLWFLLSHCLIKVVLQLKIINSWHAFKHTLLEKTVGVGWKYICRRSPTLLSFINEERVQCYI